AHRPFTPSGQGNANLRLANGVTAERLDERKSLLNAFDDTRRDVDASGTMAGMDAYTEKAIEMVTSGVVRTALDMNKEDPKVRDHWARVMSALGAGGGLKMGQAVGASTAKGERPKDRPYTVAQVLSTIYRAIGIDPSITFPNGSGRPMYVLDDREPVRELLG